MMRQSIDPRKDYSDDLLRDEMERSLSIAEELNDKTKWLPRVEVDGSSECPFADDLFEEIERLIAPAARRVEHMEIYVPVVEAHVDTRRKRLGVIMSNWGGLSPGKARDKVADAESSQAGDYDGIIHLRDDLHDLLGKLSGAVSNATHAVSHWRKCTGKDESERPTADTSHTDSGADSNPQWESSRSGETTGIGAPPSN